jgi:YHS domain-containing protein
MSVDSTNSPIEADAQGHCHFFCSNACRETFKKNPEAYSAGKRKGWLARYLDRVKKATGGKPLSCCH